MKFLLYAIGKSYHMLLQQIMSVVGWCDLTSYLPSTDECSIRGYVKICFWTKIITRRW